MFKPAFIFVPLLICLISATDGHGAKIENMEQKIKAKKLPGWCYYTQASPGWGTEKSHSYRQRFGNDWMHIHHYCWGVDKFNSALADGMQSDLSKSYMGHAVKEFDYVLQRVTNTNLQIMVLMKQGQAHMALNQYANAIANFSHTLKLNNKYTKAYLMLGQCYQNINDTGNAVRILEQGLQNIPDSSAIKTMLNQLQ